MTKWQATPRHIPPMWPSRALSSTFPATLPMPLKALITVTLFPPLPTNARESFFARSAIHHRPSILSHPHIGLLIRSIRLANYFPHAVFAGKDPSRALALSSLKAEDCRSDWEDLADKEKQVLNDWFTFFSKRYNIVGQVRS